MLNNYPCITDEAQTRLPTATEWRHWRLLGTQAILPQNPLLTTTPIAPLHSVAHPAPGVVDSSAAWQSPLTSQRRADLQ